jgi:hypothetical protein
MESRSVGNALPVRELVSFKKPERTAENLETPHQPVLLAT